MPKYIFSINSGRCGSAYLAKLFAETGNTISFHEAEPVCNGKEMRNYLMSKPGAMKTLSSDKASIIRNGTPSGYTYVDTSHLFIKGFGWYLPDILGEENIGVVIIRRDPVETAASFLRIGCTPLSQKGRDWIITPEAQFEWLKRCPPFGLLKGKRAYLAARLCKYFQPFLKNTGISTLCDLIDEYERMSTIWYIESVYQLAEVFQNKFPHITYYETSLSQLNSIDHVNQMYSVMGCQALPSLADIIGQPQNTKI